jgi:hypothetical protein
MRSNTDATPAGVKAVLYGREPTSSQTRHTTWYEHSLAPRVFSLWAIRRETPAHFTKGNDMRALTTSICSAVKRYYCGNCDYETNWLWAATRHAERNNHTVYDRYFGTDRF